MIISPPFLSLVDIPVYDDRCVREVMPGGIVGSGAFPVSQAMAWHGGVHIHPSTNVEPVRAIADGVVVFRRDNRNARYDNEDHSTGCVVIRHTTEIGAQGASGVSVTYYSITQHLRHLDASLPAVGRAIYRKDAIGLAGTIYGQSDRIHFEIVAGDADARALIGRTTGLLDTSRDGRTDAVFGEVYVRLPAKTSYFSARPTGATPTPSGDTGLEELFIGIRHAGSADLTTYRTNGEVLGHLSEPDAEYNLYTEATARHALNPTDGSPSGWYELLRFGRNLGIDPLPANAAHWRKVVVPGQPQGAWVDLNATGTTKFSDADFPHWRGWLLIDDDVTDNDSCCDSAELNAMLASPRTPGDDNPPPTLQEKAAERMRNIWRTAMQEKLARTICKFPTEWAKSEVRERWAWTRKTGNPYLPYPLEDERDYTEMSNFAQELCFWEGMPEQDRVRLGMKHWHFHPREFISQFRKCGWLSRTDLVRVLSAAPAAGVARAEVLRQSTNSTLRKYSISGTRLLQAHFLAQVGHETAWWQFREELGQDRYLRTMYEIITPAEAAEDFRAGFPQRLNMVQRGESEQQYAMRRPGVVAAKARGMDNGAANSSVGGMSGDGVRFRGRGFLQITGRRNYASYGAYRGHDFTTEPNQKLLASSDFNACDASGFFWSRERISAEANAGALPAVVTRVGGLVNRGSANKIPMEDAARRHAFDVIWSRLNDAL